MLLGSAVAGPPRAEAVQQFRSATNTVAIYASASDRAGAPVRDLTAADFEIEDDGRKQAITVFENGIQPITIAVLVDASPSLFAERPLAAAAVAAFAGRLIPGDRACLGTFNQSVSLDPRFTDREDVLVGHLGDGAAPWPAGTAVWDAVEAGRRALETEGGRRVILLLTDGADNASRSDPDAIRTALQQSGMLVFAVGVRGRFGLDMTDLGALANSTGGRALELASPADVPDAMRRVADELHNQYVIGFTPRALDDRWHRLKVKVRRDGVTVRTTRLYFAGRPEGSPR
ncbi:MAG: VWA domain-containing protein [Vicinamibacterales bacterium]